MKEQQVYQILPVELAALGEGPVWDDRLSRLLWVDIINGRVNQWHPDTRKYQCTDFPCRIGAIALTQTDEVVAATDKGFAFLNLGMGDVTYLGDPEADKDDNRFNDGRSEEHTSELQSLMRTSYAVFCSIIKKIKNY